MIIKDIKKVINSTDEKNYKSNFQNQFGNSYAMVTDLVVKGGSIRVIQTYKIECGFTNEVINNSFLENASKNLSMHADLCINLARLRIFNIVILSFLLITIAIYTYVSIKNYRPYRPIDDLLKILRFRNNN